VSGARWTPVAAAVRAVRGVDARGGRLWTAAARVCVREAPRWATRLVGCWRPCLATRRPASSSSDSTYVVGLVGCAADADGGGALGCGVARLRGCFPSPPPRESRFAHRRSPSLLLLLDLPWDCVAGHPLDAGRVLLLPLWMTLIRPLTAVRGGRGRWPRHGCRTGRGSLPALVWLCATCLRACGVVLLRRDAYPHALWLVQTYTWSLASRPQNAGKTSILCTWAALVERRRRVASMGVAWPPVCAAAGASLSLVGL